MTDTTPFRSLGDIAAGLVDKIALGTVERHPVTDRTSWLQMRARDVTASDIPSLVGCGYRTPLAVWAEKKGLVAAQGDNAILKRGRWLEPAIWNAVKDERPDWEIRAAKIYLRAPSLRLGATPDALAVDPARPGLVLIQGKIVAKPVFERDWLGGNPHGEPVVPLGYHLQTLTETILAEAAYKDAIHPVVAALVIGTFSADLYLIPVARHTAAEVKILSTAAQFWRDLDRGIEPAAAGAKDHDVVKALFPRDDGSTIDLTSNNELPALMDERKQLTGEIKWRQDRKDEIDAEIKAKIGTHSYALIAGNRKLSCKLTKVGPKSIDGYEFRSLREVKVR